MPSSTSGARSSLLPASRSRVPTRRPVGDELIVFSIHYADRVGENYFAKWPRSGEHAWSFFPEMTPDGEWP